MKVKYCLKMDKENVSILCDREMANEVVFLIEKLVIKAVDKRYFDNIGELMAGREQILQCLDEIEGEKTDKYIDLEKMDKCIDGIVNGDGVQDETI